MIKCDRCGDDTGVTTMSYFNEDTICMGCKKKERAHPDFKRAQEAEHAEVSRGNYNFEGVGLPSVNSQQGEEDEKV